MTKLQHGIQGRRMSAKLKKRNICAVQICFESQCLLRHFLLAAQRAQLSTKGLRR